MSQAFQSALEQVSHLNRAEQLALMEVIVRLLREEEAGQTTISDAWEEELNRRDALLDQGEMDLVQWEDVKRKILNKKS